MKVVTFGLNRVNPASADYAGWDGALQGCVNDAGCMAIAGERAECCTDVVSADYFGNAQTAYGSPVPSGITLVGHATAARFERVWDQIAASDPGAAWFLWISSHGAQMQFPTETVEGICLFDRIYWDTELWQQFLRVPAGVRVFIGADMCHAGGMPGTRDRLTGPFNRVKSCPVRFRGVGLPEPKRLDAIRGDILWWAGCGKMQLSLDGAHNGLFTATALAALNESESYNVWLPLVKSAMPDSQQPQVMTFGPNGMTAWLNKPIFT